MATAQAFALVTPTISAEQGPSGQAFLAGRLLLSFLSYSNRSTLLTSGPLSLPANYGHQFNNTVTTTTADVVVEFAYVSGRAGGGGGAAPHLLEPLFAQGIETMALIVLIMLVLATAKVIVLDLGQLIQAFIRNLAIFLLTCSTPDDDDDDSNDDNDTTLQLIPRHVAFIMDGNRRWAQHQGLSRRSEGHKFGYDKLHESLHWCARLGVKTVTVYAFSIENFKRPKEEVDTLMNLARDKFLQMITEDDVVKKHKMRVRVIGNFGLLPDFVQSAAAQAIQQSRDNDGVVFNVCMPYTSTEEIVSALNLVSQGVREGLLHPDDINSDLIGRCLYTRHSPPPDLVIRTSGETRLSDFLLWQGGSFTMLSFLHVMWPDFSEWDFFKVLWRYQRNLKHLRHSRQHSTPQTPSAHHSFQDPNRQERIQRFLMQKIEDVEERRLTKMCMSDAIKPSPSQPPIR